VKRTRWQFAINSDLSAIKKAVVAARRETCAFPIVYSRNLSNVRPFSSTSNMTAAQACVGNAAAWPTSGTIFSLQVFSWRVVIDEVINF